MKETTILIPTRFDNRWILDLALRSIRKYTTDCPYRIIVGDAGADEELKEFLKTQKDVEVLQCQDHARPKDELAVAVKTPYFLFLHDDIQVLKPGWLSKRVQIMESDTSLGVIGDYGFNDNVYGFHWKKIFDWSRFNRRFFPLVLLVRKETHDDLGLVWRSVKGFDTGAIAYFQFCKQKKWKFKRLKFKDDVKHWGSMTWIMKNKHKNAAWVEKLKAQKKERVELIKKMIAENTY